jgi:gluconokinase
MGVSGSGKSAVGKLLTRELGWTFVEADDYHPTANIEKMRRAISAE